MGFRLLSRRIERLKKGYLFEVDRPLEVQQLRIDRDSFFHVEGRRIKQNESSAPHRNLKKTVSGQGTTDSFHAGIH
jgi:hypothetical protein